DNLCVGRFVPLALGLGAEPRDGGTGRMDSDFGRVEHCDAQDIAVARWPGSHDLGEESNADTHQLARLSTPEGLLLGLLFGAQLLISDGVHRLAQGGLIVARVVLPAER